MGISEIKKELSKLDKVQLIDLISDLYRKNISVKEYFKFYLKPDEKNILKEYKDKVREGFFPKRGIHPRLSISRRAINDFKKFEGSWKSEPFGFYYENGSALYSADINNTLSGDGKVLVISESIPGKVSRSITITDNGNGNYFAVNDVQDFNTSLNAHIVSSGQGPLTVRLPSEAEWEYACRAGTQTRFYWGDDPDYVEINDYAWWNDSAEQSGEYYANTVGQGLPNAFGLYDVSGNVWEWCWDGFQSDWYSRVEASQRDSRGPAEATGKRVLRGGSWAYDADEARVSYRLDADPTYTDFTCGFRCVLAP